jgi:outer membrane receptor for ferrienterochelin and colicins
MKSIRILFIIFPVLFYFMPSVNAQVLKGKVVAACTEEHHGEGSEEASEEHGHEEPLVNATIYWAGTTSGVHSDDKGNFQIKLPKSGERKLVARFIGYLPDTIAIAENQKEVHIELKTAAMLNEVTVKGQAKGSYVSELHAINTQIISEAGLNKLPCCNLSESFENNASVDVNYADAVTGAKQIQLLGLAGVYSQILTENMPSIRGLASTYGLAYIPGPWMQSIQISKGTSSVINGYESTTGQINVEYKKPHVSDRFYLNLFGNQEGRAEANVTSAWKLSKNLSTMVLAHASALNTKHDENHDGFMDSPLYRQINFINRWLYEVHEKFEAQFGVKFLDETRDGGQMNFDKSKDKGTTNSYGLGVETKRTELFAKVGIPFKFRKATSLGTMYSFTNHRQNSFFGLNTYDATQNSFYTNIIFQTYLGNTNHTLNAGFSFTYDDYSEKLKLVDYSEKLKSADYKRTEQIPGVFAQYAYSLAEKFSVIAGLRADFHNLYGTLVTPRLHLKYSLDDQTRIRASIGKGYRSPVVLAENISILASSRQLTIANDLDNEEAWNMGLTFSRDVYLGGDKMSKISLDYYRTDFQKQVIVDMDHAANEVLIYNLNGKSYSNSFQVEVNYMPLDGLDITAAFRYNDVKMTMHDELVTKPFVTKYKGLLTASFLTGNRKWQFDLTNQFNGTARISETSQNPEQYRLKNETEAFAVVHAQVTHKFKHLDIYFGGENLTNYTQKNPIVAADQPFGKYFDTSMVWAPITGRMFYAGLRLTIK